MAVFLTIGTQLVNQLSNSCGIFYGENVQQGWASTSKSNTSIFAAGYLITNFSNVNIVYDPDLVDNNANRPNINPTVAPVILKAN